MLARSLGAWIYPAHRSFYRTTTLVLASSLLDALLDQLPNTQVVNATRSGGVLAQNARLVRTFFSEECTRRSRKEVIQPQVPLRLPCYDFAPVTELAFGGSLPCGLGHRLRALPTPMA